MPWFGDRVSCTLLLRCMGPLKQPLSFRISSRLLWQAKLQAVSLGQGCCLQGLSTPLHFPLESPASLACPPRGTVWWSHGQGLPVRGSEQFGTFSEASNKAQQGLLL